MTEALSVERRMDGDKFQKKLLQIVFIFITISILLKLLVHHETYNINLLGFNVARLPGWKNISLRRKNTITEVIFMSSYVLLLFLLWLYKGSFRTIGRGTYFLASFSLLCLMVWVFVGGFLPEKIATLLNDHITIKTGENNKKKGKNSDTEPSDETTPKVVDEPSDDTASKVVEDFDVENR